jgi:DNA-binding transcriptional MocR family regulator
MAFLPGAATQAERTSRTSLRLSFSYVEPELLDEGVRRLARAIRQVRRSHRHSATVPLS